MRELRLILTPRAHPMLLALYLQAGRGLSPVESDRVFTVLAACYRLTSFRAPAGALSR
jgi:hypothetical protein